MANGSFLNSNKIRLGKPLYLIPIVLLLLFSVSFAEIIQAQVADQVALSSVSAPVISAGFNLSEDPFKQLVIASQNGVLDPIQDRGDIKTAFISSAGQDIALVKMNSALGASRLFKGRYAPVFSNCAGLTCVVIEEATPSVDYKYVAGDFDPIIDVGNGIFSVDSIAYNYSQPIVVLDYGLTNQSVSVFDNSTSAFVRQTVLKWGVVGSHVENMEAWADISNLTQKAGQAVKIKLVVSRTGYGTIADVQPRAYGALIPQWGIYTDPLWGSTNCTVATVGANTTITLTSGSFNLNSSCFLNFTSSQTVSYLIVAGGAGGGSQIGGGGGAGGFLHSESFSSGVLNYTLTTGAGGLGAETGGADRGQNGSNSTLNSSPSVYISAAGGGGGGSQGGAPSWAGGSGGGAAYLTAPGNALGTAGQGFGGGATTGAGVGSRTTGGGGGANANGTTGAPGGGNGGDGNNSGISGSTLAYAAGGGGACSAASGCGGGPGTGGSSSIGGKGGSSSLTTNGDNAVANRGSGGGGGDITGSVGGNGSAGIVILSFVQPVQNTTTMVSAGTGVNPINANSPIGWNASATIVTGGAFRGFNWTIYRNGVNTTSGNYTCNNGFCTNNTQYVVKNDSPSIYGIGDQLIFSARAYTTDSVLNSTYLNSSIYTVVDNKPIITDLKIVSNSTSSTIYPNATINGNLTAQDNDTGQTLTASYSWYKNGVNQTALAGTLTMFNGTLNTTPLNCITQACVAGDSWIFGAQVNDTLNWSINVNSTATVITGFISNLTMNSTTQEYDLYSYSHGLNLTITPGMAINSVSAGYGGSFFAGTLTSSSGGAQQWNVSIQPPFSSSTNNYTVSFIIQGTYANGSSFTQVNTSNSNTTNPYTIQVNASGIYACNSTINTPTINYSFYDQANLNAINATLSATYSINSSNGSIKTTSYSAVTNTTQTICIGPSTGSFSAIASENVNALGYAPISQISPAQTYNSTLTIRQIGLINSSSGAYYTFQVSNQFSALLPGVTVLGTHFLTANNTWISIGGQTTDSTGSVIFFLIPSQLYNFTFSLSNYNTVNFQFTPAGVTTIPVILTFNTSANVNNIDAIWADTNYTITPQPGYYRIAQNITFNVTSNISGLLSSGLVIIRTINGTQVTVYSSSSTNANTGQFTYQANPNASYIIYPWFYHAPINNNIIGNYSVSPKGYQIGVAPTGSLAHIGQLLQVGNVIGPWAYFFLILLGSALGGLFVGKFFPAASGYAGLIVLWGLTYLWPGGVLFSFVTIFVASTGVTLLSLAVAYLTQWQG